MSVIINAARNYGWLLALVSVAVVLFLMYTEEAPQAVGVPLPGDKTIEVTAREPGVAYNVKQFCDDDATKVTYGTPLEVQGDHYLAMRGQETISWKDTSPSGTNPNALHTWINPAGNQESEAVEITKPAMDCMKKKVR